MLLQAETEKNERVPHCMEEEAACQISTGKIFIGPSDCRKATDEWCCGFLRPEKKDLFSAGEHDRLLCSMQVLLGSQLFGPDKSLLNNVGRRNARNGYGAVTKWSTGAYFLTASQQQKQMYGHQNCNPRLGGR